MTLVYRVRNGLQRSTRWLRYVLALTGVAVGIAFLWPYKPATGGAIFEFVRRSHIPWPIWAGSFLFYATLLIISNRRALGYWAGFVLWGFFGLAVAVQINSPIRVLVASGLIDLALFHVAAARIAEEQEVG